jgi:hypothetical protein
MSIDAIRTQLAAFFEAVSFNPGERPGYDAISGLFIEGGMLIKNSGELPEISTVEQFVAPRQALVDSGELSEFQEFEIAGISQIFGNVAHRYSTYGKHGVTNGVQFDGRGVITTQFIRTPVGWQISSMAWDDERPGLSIPD